MSFIRRIKNGKYTYLAEVENRWVNGKVVQKHIRYVGKELNGERILSGSIANTEVTGVKIWAPLIVLDKLAKQVNLSELLGDYGDYLLSMVYAHCLDPKSINKMEDWFVRTDLHNILKIRDVSEEKLYISLDSIDYRNFSVIQKNIFRSVTDAYNLKPKGYFFDVTNVYFYGTQCPIAKKGHNKEESHHPQVQIGLAVTKEEGIPIFHKTFDGNIFDARTLQDFLVEFHDLNIEDVTIVWDRGVTSENNILDAKKAGFEVICGLAIKHDVKKEVDKILNKKEKRFFKKDFSIDEMAIQEAQRYDGCSVIFSTKMLVIEEIVKPYFEKDKVEKAFRSMKSVLGLKPIKHWLEERVKSHIFICYLSYLLISLLETKIKKINITAISALDKLSTAYKVCLINKKTKNEFEKIVTLSKEQEKIMNAVDKNILKPSV